MESVEHLDNYGIKNIGIEGDITIASVFEINSEAIKKIYLFKNQFGEDGGISKDGCFSMATESLCLIELQNGEKISFSSSEWGFVQFLPKGSIIWN